MTDDLRSRLAAAFRAAAHNCPGDCGMTETECVDVHPIQVEVLHFDQIAVIGGPVEQLADVAAGVIEAEQARYEESVVGALNERNTRDCRRADKAEAQVTRIRAFLEDMAGWCSPHGVAADYSRRGLDALDGVDPLGLAGPTRQEQQDRNDTLDAAIAHTALAAIRDYLETSDDTGTRTREQLLGMLDQAGVPSVVAEVLDGADRYADMVDAPLRPETIAALAERIKAGDLPVRKVKPREQP